MRIALPVLALLASGCSRDTTQASTHTTNAVAVQAAAVTERAVPRWIIATGSLRAEREADVAANVPGKVVSTAVERGQEVKAGQVLMTLDARSAALSAKAAAAQSNMAKSQAEWARLECERGKQLFEAQTITKAEFDRRMTECNATTSSLEAADAQQQVASKILSDNTIRAPFAGVVGERFAEVGQYVRADSPVVSLYSMNLLRLILTLPESAVASVSAGLPIEFEVAAFPGTTFKGVIDRVSPQIRPLSRDLVVEAVIDNAERKLRPGMFASARLRIGEDKRPSVPKTALRKTTTDARVFAIVDGRAEERIVHVVGQEGDYAALDEGVAVGEKAIAKPSADIRDGVAVEAK